MSGPFRGYGVGWRRVAQDAVEHRARAARWKLMSPPCHVLVGSDEDGTSVLVGPMVDQATLYGLLGRVPDLGATLLSMEQSS